MALYQNHSTIENRFLSLAGVIASCYFILWASPITFFSDIVSLGHSYYIILFERHFWQYLFAFIGVTVLSRGHLWSYGINSQNLKTSMIWLSWLYSIVIVATIIALWSGHELLPVGAENVQEGKFHAVTAMLVYWMSSPVANQILFFGFGQTILMKQWGDGLKIGRFPVVVIFTALLFTYGATTSQFAFGEYSAMATFMLGLFCGMVYWKTNSLITPMLGQAFFFGFPFFVHIVRTMLL